MSGSEDDSSGSEDDSGGSKDDSSRIPYPGYVPYSESRPRYHFVDRSSPLSRAAVGPCCRREANELLMQKRAKTATVENGTKGEAEQSAMDQD